MTIKFCKGCQKNRLPEGGCEIGLKKWVCASCWAAKRFSFPNGKINSVQTRTSSAAT